MSDYCIRCGVEIEPWEIGIYSGSYLCSHCYQERASSRAEFPEICTNCYKRLREKEANRKLGKTLCEKCYEEEIKKQMEFQCVSCKKWIYDETVKRKMPDGRIMCLDCYRKFGGGKLAARVCAHCERKTTEYLVSDVGKIYCSACSSKIAESLREPEEPIIEIEEESPVIKKLRGVITKMLGH